MPEEMIFVLLAKLDPNDKGTMLENLADLLTMLEGGTDGYLDLMDADGNIAEFTHLDVITEGLEAVMMWDPSKRRSFNLLFWDTMDIFFNKHKTLTTEYSEDLISIFIGYLMKRKDADCATLQMYLDKIEQSVWFKKMGPELKASVEALKRKIESDCVGLFLKKA